MLKVNISFDDFLRKKEKKEKKSAHCIGCHVVCEKLCGDFIFQTSSNAKQS